MILAIDPDDRKAYSHNLKFKNLDITNIQATIEGKPNQLYTSGMKKENTFDQILRLFRENGVSLGEFLTEKYALCLDMRPSIDPQAHGNGVDLVNTSEGITLQINRIARGTGKLNLLVYVLQDVQLNFQYGRYHSMEK